MQKIDLLDNFIHALNDKATSKKELAYIVGEILGIEKESAYRRLGRQVQFTIPEMGVLAKEMNISLDALIGETTGRTPILFNTNLNTRFISIDTLIDMVEESVISQEKINQEANVEILFESIPIELFIFYPNLCKFMYLKWAHYYTGSPDFDNFSNWEIPKRLTNLHDRLIKCFKKYKHILYIWDNSLILNLINEIKYHLSINVLQPAEVALIKKDILCILKDVEEFTRGNQGQNFYNTDFEFYVTYFNVGMTGYCISSENTCLSSLKSPFLYSALHYDFETGNRISEWINSIKKFSYLISGSGEKERILFIKEQQQLLESI